VREKLHAHLQTLHRVSLDESIINRSAGKM
jgi:hypothetical protein